MFKCFHSLRYFVLCVCVYIREMLFYDIAEFQADYSTDYETIEDIEQETTVLMVDDDSFIITCF